MKRLGKKLEANWKDLFKTEVVFVCSICGLRFEEHEGGAQCPTCGRIFCLSCTGDYPITKVEVMPNGPDYKRWEAMCKICREVVEHMRRLIGLKTTKIGIDERPVEIVDVTKEHGRWEAIIKPEGGRKTRRIPINPADIDLLLSDGASKPLINNNKKQHAEMCK